MPLRSRIPAGLLLLVAITKGDVIAQSTAVPTMTLLVDETQAFRRIAFVHEEIRVHPGPLALAYPRWIPGEHGPTGPIQNLAAIRVHSGEVTLPWTRDPDDINTIKVDLPSNWKQGSSMPVTNQAGNRVTFAPTSLERLIDSPVLAGEFFRAVPLAAKWPAELDFTGDSQSAIAREIQYAGGLRYPHLERIPGTHDYLTEILAPRSAQGQ